LVGRSTAAVGRLTPRVTSTPQCLIRGIYVSSDRPGRRNRPIISRDLIRAGRSSMARTCRQPPAPPDPVRSRGKRIEDEAPTLVLMPGLYSTGLLFEHFVSALPPHIRTHIIEYPKDAAPLEEYAALVAGRLSAGRVVLLAESFSSIIASCLLRKHHALVERVVFVASFGSAPRRYLKLLLPLSHPSRGPSRSSRAPPGASSVWGRVPLPKISLGSRESWPG
jgi:pimeloyl-ACP methyl ester carboxylesterase